MKTVLELRTEAVNEMIQLKASVCYCNSYSKISSFASKVLISISGLLGGGGLLSSIKIDPTYSCFIVFIGCLCAWLDKFFDLKNRATKFKYVADELDKLLDESVKKYNGIDSKSKNDRDIVNGLITAIADGSRVAEKHFHGEKFMRLNWIDTMSKAEVSLWAEKKFPNHNIGDRA